MALTTNEKIVLRDMFRATGSSDASIDAMALLIRNATEAELRTQIRTFATAKVADLDADIAAWVARKAIYESVLA